MTIEENRGEDQPKPFLEHLADLRTTLLGCLAAWGIGMALVMPFAPRLFTLLQAPLATITEHPEQFLRSLEITGGFFHCPADRALGRSAGKRPVSLHFCSPGSSCPV